MATSVRVPTPFDSRLGQLLDIRPLTATARIGVDGRPTRAAPESHYKSPTLFSSSCPRQTHYSLALALELALALALALALVLAQVERDRQVTAIRHIKHTPGLEHQDFSTPSWSAFITPLGPLCPNHQPVTYPPPRPHSEWPTHFPRPLALSLGTSFHSIAESTSGAAGRRKEGPRLVINDEQVPY